MILGAPRHSLGGYREYSVPADLREIADAIWCYSRPAGAPPIPGGGHRVLPDTNVSVCFWSRRDAGGCVSDPQVIFMGPAPSVHFFDPLPGVHLEAIRLKPEWSRDLFGMDPGEHRDVRNALQGSTALRDALSRTRGSGDAIDVLLNELRSRHAAARIERGTVIAHDVLEHLRATDAAIGTLPRLVRVSERQMRRSIHATTGLSAKRAQRIIRINRAVVAADRVARPDWATIALDAGFYDQSHMIDEMRELTGLTPSALCAERRMQQS